MKIMTCRQLGGACDLEFRANTFEEMMEMSKAHGKEMFAVKDKHHLKAMNKIQILMQTPQAMTEWVENKRKEFDLLSEE